MSKDGKVVIDIEADDSGFKDTVNDVESEAKDAAGSMNDLGDAAKKAGDDFGIADVAVGSFIGNALSGLVSAVGNAVQSFIELSDSTREYREDMAKLETAFSSAGGSTEAAKKSYEDFYAILGESDRSVEAVNHLAELTKNEEELAKWSDIAAGVTAKFGDSLPIEGLTEAANHTAKLGEVQGPLADALEWIGISSEDFNKKLAECNTEQERATLITETLSKKYQTAADEYNELTKNTQDARRATSEMEAAQAEMGAALEPVTTAWTKLKTSVFEAMLPIIQNVVTKLHEFQRWAEENPEKVEIIKGVLLGLVVALGALGIALGIGPLISTVTTAFTALNTAMLANPIGIVIAALAGLVAAFVYLWNNCEAFREFWIDLWDKVSTAASKAWNAITKWFSEAWDAIKEVWNSSGIGEYFATIWAVIKGIFSVVKAVLSGNFGDAWKAIKGIWDAVSGYFSDIWTKVKEIFAPVTEWFREKFQAAKDAVTNIWDTIKDYFTEVYNNILGVFDDIKEKFFTVGDNIINGIWDGLKAGWDWLKGKVSNLASSLFDAANEALDINSPSRKFMWTGEMATAGVGVGWEKELPKVEDQIQKDLAGLTARVQATVGAENARAGRSMAARDNGIYDLARAVGTQTAGINSLATEYRRGAGSMKPVILQLNGRELGRAVVDVGGTEEMRVGTRLALGAI